MNELSHGQRIQIPGSIVRSVSFEKIREGSLTSRSRPDKENTNPHRKIYEDVINKKLQGNPSTIRPTLKYSSKQKDRKEDLKRQLQQKEMRQCTFHPKIKAAGGHRTVEEFVGQQMAFEKHKQDKVREMRDLIKAKVEQDHPFQPNSQKAHEQKPDTHIHERLYEEGMKRLSSREQSTNRINQSKSKSQRKITTVSRQCSIKSFAPSLQTSKQLSAFNVPFSSYSSREQKPSLKEPLPRNNSNKSIHEKKGLRVTKNMDVQEVCERKLRGERKEEQVDSKGNTKNKQIYVKKVLRQISAALTELNLNKQSLSYLQVGQLLEKMNFIDPQDSPEAMSSRRHVNEIWQMLQGDLYERILLMSLIKVIFALLGCHDCSIIDIQLKAVLQEEPTRSLVLTEKDSRAIRANFQELALNRLKKGEFITKQAKHQTYSFHPFVSKQSTDMAEKYRQRVLQESEKLLNGNLIQYPVGEDGLVDHVDLLMLDEKRKALKLQLQREEKEKQKRRRQDEAMRPEKATIKQNEKDLTLERNRFSELYEMGRENLRAKHQKTSIGVSQECTFRPNILKPSRESSGLKADYSGLSQPEDVKDFDKSVFRMYEGRRIRQQSQHGRSAATEHHSSCEDHSALLYLNVNVQGNQDVKIPVFHSDNMKSITQKVRQMADLFQADEQRLEEILRLQIVPALQEFGILSQTD